mmetsp:Transcript_79572/g.245419  ORF Transcript_79572/g.245419 Transcript_79572/m.245419 type:complete len:370 (+) Transcript_79572:438-1547(+)
MNSSLGRGPGHTANQGSACWTRIRPNDCGRTRGFTQMQDASEGEDDTPTNTRKKDTRKAVISAAAATSKSAVLLGTSELQRDMAPKVPSVGEGTMNGSERRTPKDPETNRLVSSVIAKMPKTSTKAAGETARAEETGACTGASGRSVKHTAMRKTIVSLKYGASSCSRSSAGTTTSSTSSSSKLLHSRHSQAPWQSCATPAKRRRLSFKASSARTPSAKRTRKTRARPKSLASNTARGPPARAASTSACGGGCDPSAGRPKKASRRGTWPSTSQSTSLAAGARTTRSRIRCSLVSRASDSDWPFVVSQTSNTSMATSPVDASQPLRIVTPKTRKTSVTSGRNSGWSGALLNNTTVFGPRHLLTMTLDLP